MAQILGILSHLCPTPQKRKASSGHQVQELTPTPLLQLPSTHQKISCRDADLVALQFKLNECHSHTAYIERNHQGTVTRQENRVMKDHIAELRSKAAALEVDLEAKVSEVRALEEELVLAEKKRELMKERDSIAADACQVQHRVEHHLPLT